MPNKIVGIRNRRFAVAAVCMGGLMTAMFFQNCGKVGTAAGLVSGSSTADSSSTGGGPSPVPITLSNITSQTANLGTQLTIPVNVTVPTSYSGTLTFAVKTPELGLLDPGAGIKFSFNPATVAVTGQGSAQTTLTVNVTTLAPSFTLSMFHIYISDASNMAIHTDVPVALQVNATYEVTMDGPATAGVPSPEKWSAAIGSVTGFISHAEGMTIKFLNNTAAVHRVHSGGGPIPHQPADMAGGGNYTVVVPAGVTTATSQVYCHDDEAGTQIRTFQFNVPVVPVVVGASGNPNASFAFINTNVLQSMCLNCHSTANPQSGINVSSYTNVLKIVTKNNASVSALYNAVAPGGNMPLGGTALSAALVKDISDWINDGAANN